MSEALDFTGQPLAVGNQVEAYWDGKPYTATVMTILPEDPGCDDHRHVVLQRDGDGAVIDNRSDAVLVIA
jgi:hypothetical protein